MQDSLKTLDPFKAIRSHVMALDSYSLNNSLISMESVSFRGLFTEMYNTVNLGRHGAGHTKVDIPTPDQFAMVRKLGYDHFKTIPIPVAPGFNGNLMEFIKLANGLVDSFGTLPNDLTTLRAFLGNVLNGSNLLDNLSGNPILEKLSGVDPNLANTLKEFFQPNLIREAVAGKIYKNLQEWDDSYQGLSKILALYKRLDILKITDLSKGFNNLLKELKISVDTGHLRKHLSSKAVAQLSSKVERVAVGVSLTSVLGSTLVEIADAKSQEITKLCK